MPIPVVPLIVAIQAPVGPVHVAGSATIPTVIWTTGSAASHRVFAARCRTILRQRQRSPTRQQRGHNREKSSRLSCSYFLNTQRLLTHACNENRTHERYFDPDHRLVP